MWAQRLTGPVAALKSTIVRVMEHAVVQQRMKNIGDLVMPASGFPETVRQQLREEPNQLITSLSRSTTNLPMEWTESPVRAASQ